MKKITFLLFIALSFTQLSFGQVSGNFEKDFNTAIVDLADNKLHEAKVILAELYRRDSINANLAYLYGQSLVRLDTNLPYAIHLLKKASKAYTPEYRRGHYDERRVSEYVYYYLLMAYSLNGDCDKTLETLNLFYKIYSYANEWYLVDGQRLHLECEQRERPPKEEPVVEIKDERKAKKHIIGTKEVQYTDKTALYGVQVSALIEPVFTYEFKNLKNIEVYVDENGVYRYIIGRFLFEAQAKRLLKAIQEAGYPDAFIVNVKDKKRYKEEVITLDQESVHKVLVGKVDFRVQVGAFKGDTIPEDMMNIYLQLDSLSQVEYNGYSIITTGSFDNYDAAELFAEIIHDMGVEDAYVTAWNYNKKVDIKQARLYLEEQQKAQEEADSDAEPEEKPQKSRRK